MFKSAPAIRTTNYEFNEFHKKKSATIRPIRVQNSELNTQYSKLRTTNYEFYELHKKISDNPFNQCHPCSKLNTQNSKLNTSPSLRFLTQFLWLSPKTRSEWQYLVVSIPSDNRLHTKSPFPHRRFENHPAPVVQNNWLLSQNISTDYMINNEPVLPTCRGEGGI